MWVRFTVSMPMHEFAAIILSGVVVCVVIGLVLPKLASKWLRL